MRKLSGLLVVATALIAQICHGQQPSLENWYQVEVIIFAQQDVFGAEARPPEPQLEYPAPLRMLNSAEQLFAPVPRGGDLNETLAALMIPPKFLTREEALKPAAFVPLEPNLRNLNGESRAMGRSGPYRVLFHSAWQQEIGSSRTAPWVAVSGGEAFGDHRELEGAVRIFRGRSIQAGFNLWLGQFAPPAIPAVEDPQAAPSRAVSLPPPPQPAPSRALQQLRLMDALAGAEPATTADGMTSMAKAARFEAVAVDVLKRTEQVGLNNLTYVDHPRMGALVLVTPLEKAEEEAESE